MTNAWKPLHEFLKSPEQKKREWISVETSRYTLSTYLRKTRRYIHHRIYQTIDLASIEVFPEHQGGCSALLDILEAIETVDAVFVESVLNPQFSTYLMRRGYEHVGTKDQLDYVKFTEISKEVTSAL